MNRLPFVPGVVGTPFGKTLANSPSVRDAFENLSEAIKAELESELLELVRLRVASNNGCDYWRSSRDAALDEQKRNVAICEDQQAALTTREALALDYTDRLMAYHGNTTPEMIESLKNHFTHSEIVALTFQIGLMNAANWFVIAMDLERE